MGKAYERQWVRMWEKKWAKQSEKKWEEMLEKGFVDVLFSACRSLWLYQLAFS
jgi:hypothetical protein